MADYFVIYCRIKEEYGILVARKEGIIVQELKETIDLCREAFLSFDPEIWAATITMVLVYIVELMLTKREIICSGRKKKLRKAKEAGHMVQGVRIKSTLHHHDDGSRWCTALYEYQVGEYRGKYVTSFEAAMAPAGITLYYVNSPRKVFTSQWAQGGRLDFLVFIVPIIAGVVVANLLGYKPK